MLRSQTPAFVVAMLALVFRSAYMTDKGPTHFLNTTCKR